MKLFRTLCLLFFPVSICAQSKSGLLEQQVNFNLNADSIQVMAAEINKQAHINCYFIPEIFDSIRISLKGRMKIKDAFDKAFPKSMRINYAADDRGNIYLTQEIELSMRLGQRPNGPSRPGMHLPVASRFKLSHNGKKPPSEPVAAIQAKSIVLDYDENKLFTIGDYHNNLGYATITGYVRHRATGEGIGHASITVADMQAKVVTDAYGYYTITLPKGRHTLMITCIGLADARRQIDLRGADQFNVQMHDYVTSLKGVTISAEKSSNIQGTQMGVNKVDMKTLRQMPALMGEADILRVVQTLPGVTSAGEGSTGLNVRGGNVDQNLVLLDGATIYNPSHFFGFFSGFNPDLVKDAELYKSSIPVSYGSRLSSVLDVITREGNRQQFTGNGGIGPLSAHLTLEGPVSKKTAVIVGARSTYSDWVLRVLKDKAYQSSRAGFYDANIKVTSDIDNKNNLYISAYNSGDRFRLDGDTLYHYGNLNGVAKWKHIFNNNLYSDLSIGADNYKFNMASNSYKVAAYKFKFGVSQYHLNINLHYSPNNTHKVSVGLATVYYKLNPGTYSPIDSSLIATDQLQKEQGLESALYINDQYAVSDKFTIDAGIRYSLFNYLGPHSNNNYAPGIERTLSNIISVSNYGGGRFIKSYQGPEPRISMRYSLSSATAVKASYNRTRQYIHMLSNTTVVSPTDIWKLSDPYIKPELADQVSLGIYHNSRDNVIETSIEVYHKWIQHAISYKNGAILIMNHHIETDLANADGKAYGAEFLVKKTAGKLNGWLSYTYSRTFLRMRDPLVKDLVNDGAYYPADYDRPNVVNLVGNYRFSHRFSVSLTSVYTTGRPITLPETRYYYAGAYRVYYADRNQYRIPDYFRTDLSINIEGNHKIRKLAHSSWTLGAYNLFGRRNAYSVYFITENGQVKGYKMSIFGTAIPFLTYNFKF